MKHPRMHNLGKFGTPRDRAILSVVVIALLLTIMSVVGHMGLQDELDTQDRYCEGVASGLHPDYNGNAKEICPKP